MQVKKKSATWYRRLFIYMVTKVLIFSIGLTALTAVSFLFFGEWSALAYSDRLFMVGVIVITMGGLAMIVLTFTSKEVGNPRAVRTPEEARSLLDNNFAIRGNMEKRYNIATQLWLIGLGCFGFSVLMYNLLT